MNKKIYVVRHGQTDFNKQGIVQGSGVDSSLNGKGRAQANAFFEQYQHLPFEVLITSKLLRTHETMNSFIQKGIPWEQNEWINEIGWGIHEGKRNTEAMHLEYKKMIQQWLNGNYQARLEQGESAQELGDRMTAFLDHLKHRNEQQILVCSHGRAMRCMMALMKGGTLSDMEKYKHSNTGLYVVNWIDGRFQFELENDTSHLASLF